MNRLICWLAISAVTCIFIQGATAQPPRVIPFDRSVPIVERLRADDTTVIVKKTGMPPLAGSGRETFEEEIKRLAHYDTIAIVRVLALEGQVIDSGTWVRTEARTQVRELVRDQLSTAQSGLLVMTHDGGKVRVRNIVVDAGIYPVFSPGEHYLVFVALDRARKTHYPSAAFRVDEAGVVRAMQNSDGTLILPESSLIGRTAAEIGAALATK